MILPHHKRRSIKICDVFVSFAGNLTKHMKSKAHMKKCLELGVSVSMDEAEIQEHGKMLMFM